MPSKIIKGEGLAEPSAERPAMVRPSRPGVVEAEVYDAHQRAREILEQAERQASQILEGATAQRDDFVAKAREAGRQEGLAQTTEIVLRARRAHQALLQGAEQDILRLSLQVAEKILGRSLEQNRELMLSIVAQAIETVRYQRELVVRVNPDDAELLRSSRRQLMDLIGRTKEIAVREDPEVERGGCVIETEHGTVDAQLRTQLQVLEQVLLGPQRPGDPP